MCFVALEPCSIFYRVFLDVSILEPVALESLYCADATPTCAGAGQGHLRRTRRVTSVVETHCKTGSDVAPRVSGIRNQFQSRIHVRRYTKTRRDTVNGDEQTRGRHVDDPAQGRMPPKPNPVLGWLAGIGQALGP